MNECVRCRNDWHEGCNGGSWDDQLKPVVCSCWALKNHGAPLITRRRRTFEEVQADRMGDRYEAALERGVA